ncbi:MAG: divalent-cation tolerance protein CutA [Alphaproteobacteria bacterium]
MPPIFIYITCADAEEAEKIGRAAVEARVAACANVIPGMKSIYLWEDKAEMAEETVLILKTQQPLFDRVVGLVKELHSYDMPCIVALPLVAGTAEYLDWLASATDDGLQEA